MRKPVFVSSLSRVFSTLQWGRNFIVAETIMAWIRRIATAKLQWGRNFIVAETGTRGTLRGPQYLLQWGRNFIVAETASCGAACRRRRSCFNGAATLSLRKLMAVPMVFGMMGKLQWGRNFIVAETQVQRQKQDLEDISFNGAATLSLRKLEWQGCYCDEGCRALQWGRNFIVAETMSVLVLALNSCTASMGPQLYRCGNAVCGSVHVGK